MVEIFHHLNFSNQNKFILKGFERAGITEGITAANSVIAKCENLFDELKNSENLQCSVQSDCFLFV